ncbi:MAG: DUF4347 domain-containing protein, partial [Xenococcaceae cyanobacterium]
MISTKINASTNLESTLTLDKSQFNSISNTLVVIDSGVKDYQFLADGVIAGVSVIILDDRENGIEQITKALANYKNISTIHLISHGAPGCLYLGNSQLNLDNLERYQEDLKTWFAPSFNTEGRKNLLLLYGCQVAMGDAGVEFLQKLHHLTGANIAASKTLTGSEILGGDWELPVRIGEVETSLALKPETKERYAGVLATP